MRSIWNEAEYADLARRIDRLSAERTPLWGRMSCAQMVVHATDHLRMALGELPVGRMRVGPFRYFPLKQLLIYWLPSFRNAPTPAELRDPEPKEWSAGIRNLRRALEQVRSRGPAGPWGEHAAFGKLSGQAWGTLIARHLDHHLRQFGL